MRLDARHGLGVGVALITMAAMGGACANVFSIDLNECSTPCLSGPADDPPAVEGDPTADIILSLPGGRGSTDARSELIIQAKDLPPVLIDGLPSAITDVAARTTDDEGVSPYAFFAKIIEIPFPVGAQTGLSAASFSPVTPSLTSRLRDLLWAGNEFFGPASGDIASRRAVPVRADTDALYGALYGGRGTRTRVTPTASPSPVSEPPSSGVAKPFGQVGDETGWSAGISSDSAESNK